ncbi:MAG: hypothetical protein HQK53_07740 [Oligoflexia bacterium]|nr:hypothetical protein [Oligoflexia bacterium]
MKKIIKIALFTILIVFILSSLPAFYFNQLETKEKPIYTAIETAKQAAFDNIEQRSGREGGVKSADEYDHYSKLINDNLEKMGSLIGEHESLVNRQGQFIFLLPSKYKNYYIQKKVAFDKYHLALRNFKLLKDSETTIMDSWLKSSKFSSIMSDLAKRKDIGIDLLKNTGSEFSASKLKLELAYKNGFLTADLYNKLSKDLQYFIESFALVTDWKEKKISDDEFGNRFKELSSNTVEADAITLISESRIKITNVKAQEWKDLYDVSIEFITKAQDLYDKANLSEDNLNRALALFKASDSESLPIRNNDRKEEKNIDLNGDGQQETVRLTVKYIDENNSEVSLTAYDQDGNEVGRLPDDLPINEPMSGTARVFTPVKNDKKQFISYEYVVGPHSSETMFFGLFDLKDGKQGILPVCLTKDVKGASDCLFWSGEVETLEADDFDKDGVLEVVEMVDEYPKDGALNKEINDAVDKSFKEHGKEASDGALRVLKREQGGRGNRVIWGIYKYNDSFFEKQIGKDYDKYYVLVKDYLKNLYPKYPTIMKKSEMSKSSLEYNEFMRSYWTGGI